MRWQLSCPGIEESMPYVTMLKRNFYAFFMWYSGPRTPLHLDGGLKQIFPNFMPVNLAKYDVNIICRYSKDMEFHKIWRV